MSYNFSNFKTDLKKVEEWLLKEYSQIHTGRASPAVLDSIYIDSYGSKMPIKNIASITVEDPKSLRVVLWDKSQIKTLEKAVQAANIGLSVAVDDQGLRVIFPQLTEETRGQLVKVLRLKMEEARISIRKEREDVWSKIQIEEKDGKMSEDDKFRAKDELQKIIDEANQKLEEVFNKKEKEVMS